MPTINRNTKFYKHPMFNTAVAALGITLAVVGLFLGLLMPHPLRSAVVRPDSVVMMLKAQKTPQALDAALKYEVEVGKLNEERRKNDFTVWTGIITTVLTAVSIGVSLIIGAATISNALIIKRPNQPDGAVQVGI